MVGDCHCVFHDWCSAVVKIPLLPGRLHVVCGLLRLWGSVAPVPAGGSAQLCAYAVLRCESVAFSERQRL